MLTMCTLQVFVLLLLLLGKQAAHQAVLGFFLHLIPTNSKRN